MRLTTDTQKMFNSIALLISLVIFSAHIKAEQDYDWVFDGLKPDLGIDQLLHNTKPFSKEFKLGLIECGHLKSGLRSQLSASKEFFSSDEVNFNKYQRDRIRQKIDYLSAKGPEYLKIHMASHWATYQLGGDRIKEKDMTNFYYQGTNRYFIDDKDYYWANLTDIAVLKQEMAFDNLEACHDIEKAWEEIFSD